MSTFDEYKKYKEIAEQAQKKASKAEGALSQVMEQLKELNCQSLDDAEALIKKLEKKQKQIEVKLNKAILDFETKWKDKI